MVIGSFPAVKLAWLAIRQISLPIAQLIKNEAKRNPFFRNNICMPPAQRQPVEVIRLNEATAIDLGANVLGELFVFAVGALALLYEYTRQSKKEARREKKLELEKVELRNRVAELYFRVEQKNAQLREISRILVELDTWLGDIEGTNYMQDIIIKNMLIAARLLILELLPIVCTCKAPNFCIMGTCTMARASTSVTSLSALISKLGQAN
uniref:OPA3-like protein CG13603 n=1 Tax=Glossina pallidipes TaxID=7398 RepID=A0A1B0A904_GLOPL